MSDIQLIRFTDLTLEKHIPALARLRIEVFRDYPYLYDGDMDYEADYLRTYLQSPDSVIVGAFDGATMVGAATGVPLEHETDNVKQPFIRAGYAIQKVFYLGESILQRDYRGQGIGVRFFNEREAHARACGNFEYFAFCGVVRGDDPRRPMDYVPLDKFWLRRGYHQVENLIAYYTWREIGDTQETTKHMQFWLKENHKYMVSD